MSSRTTASPAPPAASCTSSTLTLTGCGGGTVAGVACAAAGVAAGEAAEESGGADERGGRLERDLDAGEARLVFEEAAAAFEALDLGAHVRQFALHVDGVLDLMRALHNLEQLRFERLLRAQTGFEVN